MADRTYVDEAGSKWDSRYESQVFRQFELLGCNPRRCSAEEGDTIPYTTSVVRGKCLECESDKVVQSRTYTPDLFVDSIPGAEEYGGFYVEAKGYWPAPKRNLLRGVHKGGSKAPVVLVLQKDRWVTRGKSKYTDYARRFLPQWGVMVWDNTPRLAPGEKRGGKKIVEMLDLAQILRFLGGREC